MSHYMCNITCFVLSSTLIKVLVITNVWSYLISPLVVLIDYTFLPLISPGL